MNRDPFLLNGFIVFQLTDLEENIDQCDFIERNFNTWATFLKAREFSPPILGYFFT